MMLHELDLLRDPSRIFEACSTLLQRTIHQEWQHAIAVLRKAIASANQVAELHHLASRLTAELAQTLMAIGRAVEALEVLEAVEAGGASAAFSRCMAQVLAELGRVDSARRWQARYDRLERSSDG